MKTKLRTLAAVATLFLIGAINTIATANNSKLTYIEYTVENEYSLSVEEWMTNDDFWTPKTEAETVENERPLQVEPWMTIETVWK